jgi:hypothetical protein
MDGDVRRLDKQLELAAVLGGGQHGKAGQVEDVLDGAAGCVICHWGLR